MEVDEEDVCLREVLEHEVELLDDGHAVVAGELLVPLADYVVQDVVRTLNVHLGGRSVRFLYCIGLCHTSTLHLSHSGVAPGGQTDTTV